MRIRRTHTCLLPTFCFALASSCFGQPAAPMLLKCHKMDAPESVLAPDETLMHGMACRQVKQTTPAQIASVAPAIKVQQTTHALPLYRSTF
jgi:hypothetical protein